MRTLLSFITLLLFSFAPGMVQAQLSPKASCSSDNMDISYSQPSKRDRLIFGSLVPYGEVWRTGANEATLIQFKKDVSFGGKPVKKGTYALFTIPREKEWTVILNGVTDQWGAYEYAKHKSSNVAEVVVPTYALDKPQEKLTINARKDALVIEWDNTGVSIPVK